MRQILSDIQTGAFAEDWIDENANGRPRFNARRQADVQHPIEQIGLQLRRMMPFVNPREVTPGSGGA
jgi:ketol-acid reductoisomerase